MPLDSGVLKVQARRHARATMFVRSTVINACNPGCGTLAQPRIDRLSVPNQAKTEMISRKSKSGPQAFS